LVYNWSNPPEKRVLEHGYAAKNFGTQTALEVTTDAIQILGSNGLTPEYLSEKLFRDARTTTICDGSNDTNAIVGGNMLAQTYPRKP
jgi:alkylation response protein AidB-like acyl-CoA dehydrogenase